MTTHHHSREAAEARLGHEIATIMTAQTEDLPHDISERLRIARLNAVEKLRQQHRLNVQVHQAHSGAASLSLSGDHLHWWNRLAAALPVLLLVVGLFGISEVHDQSRAQELAAVDAALLTDALPPAAYTDPGFIRFVKMQEEEALPAMLAQ
jgi:uncharacterized lipoprotein